MLIRTWTTKDGERIPLNKMERSHIINCINKIQRSRKGWRKEWLEPLMLELEIRDMQDRL